MGSKAAWSFSKNHPFVQIQASLSQSQSVVVVLIHVWVQPQDDIWQTSWICIHYKVSGIMQGNALSQPLVQQDKELIYGVIWFDGFVIR